LALNDWATKPEIEFAGKTRPVSDWSTDMRILTALSWLTIAAAAQTTGLQPGASAVRSQQNINRDHGADVKDAGAVCDGVMDDTAAVQEALNATPSNGKLSISGRCLISGTVYIPASATGMILEGTRFGPGVGLVASTGPSPFQMLRVYASQVHLRDLILDCNHTATSGLVLADAGYSKLDTVRSSNCTSDGNEVNPFATPATTTTSAINVGASSGSTVTVASAALPGLTLGGQNCAEIMLDYGTLRQEFFEFKGVGNTLTQILPTRAAYTHPAGSTIQCNGNNDSMILDNLQGFYNSGWGLNIFEGVDNNDITVRDPTWFVNALGGELWAGSVNKHYGGHAEGNGGPALQLGDINGGSSTPAGRNGRVTFFSVIESFMDLENTVPAYNAVTSICDGHSLVSFKSPSELLFNGPGGPFCPALPAGVTTLGTGYDHDGNGWPRFTIKSIAGTISMDPRAGVGFYGAGGTLKNVFGSVDAWISGKLSLGPDIQISGNQLNLQPGSSAGEIALNRSGKVNANLTVYDGAATPKVTLSTTGSSTFIGVRATGLSGSGSRPACLDTAGNLYAGTNAGGVLTCP
jgi:hypothetical protein